MAMGWDEIEQVAGMEGIRARVRREILPGLSGVEQEPPGKQSVEGVVTVGMGVFAALFFTTMIFLPETFFGMLLRFILFPFLFLGSLLVTLWIFRARITAFVLRAHGRMQVRGRILSQIAAHLGLSYVGAPGKPPAAFLWLAGQVWVPGELRRVLKEISGTGEMLAAVEALRDSGLISDNTVILGSHEQKALYQDQLAANLHFEDGFHGVRGGVGFDILEWIERQDEASDIYHLIIVLKSPRRNRTNIQLKSDKASWWRPPGDKPMQKVRVGPEAFRAAYDVRAQDQVEAHALFDPAVIARMTDITHGDTFRASALHDALVFDIAGENRFAVLDVSTGQWSEETVRRAISDLAEALSLVDALAEAFRARKSPAV